MPRRASRFYTGVSPNPKAVTILDKLSRVLTIRRGAFSSLKAHREKRDAFTTLVVTVLSQNSTDKGALKAFENLNTAIGPITAENLSKASISKIERSIAIGGLQEQKAKGLKLMAQVVREKYGGKVERVFDKPLDEAREELMQLPQVGPKTADVLLVTAAGMPTIPIDTHCDRVSRRLGLAPLKGGYEQVRESLQGLFPPSKYHQVHLLLIAHGRTYCTALRPKCPICPVRQYCPYPSKTLA